MLYEILSVSLSMSVIILKDTPLFADLECLKKPAELKKNDFV